MKRNEYQSHKFKYISFNLGRLMSTMLRNEKVRRYIYYLGKEHPLNPDLKDVSPQYIIDKNVYYQIYTEEVLSDEQVTLFFNPINQDFSGGTLAREVYQLDIVVPEDAWLIYHKGDMELRAYSILQHIAEDIDGRAITGIGEVEIIDSFMQSLSKGYTIVSTIFEVNTSMRS